LFAFLLGSMLEGLFSSQNYQLAQKVLEGNQVRHRGIVQNLANLETPGYKRVDVDVSFRELLSRELGRGQVSSVGAPELREDTTARSIRADGNNVSLDREMMALNQNALEHEMLTQFLSGNLKRLKMAISGKLS